MNMNENEAAVMLFFQETQNIVCILFKLRTCVSQTIVYISFFLFYLLILFFFRVNYSF